MTTAFIVVGVDGSPTSLRALRWAGKQAELTGASVRAIMGWEYPRSYVGYPFAAVVDWRVNAEHILASAVETVFGADNAEVFSTVVEGHPARVLLDAAAGAELIVVGNRGHGGFVEALLGSVTQHVIAHATCPVLVVRQDPGP